MELHSWYLYTTVAFLTIISPGPAVLLAITNGLQHNLRSVVFSSIGNILGLFCLSSVSMLGLGAILHTSATIFFIMKLIGASYLIYLGIKQFRNVSNIFEVSANQIKREKDGFKIFKRGFLICVTNPKPIIFFTAIFPLFMNANAAIFPQFLIMTFTFMFISFSTLFTYAYFARYFKFWFSNNFRVNLFNRISGAIFVLLGFGLLKMDNRT
ncbi:LysE family translocator [Sulfurospirillum arcachonense]|uniref:LysE family translocator n=1 Tax=Sulfurospirillum arcachonense TaxID=57666 RepID=UPI0004681021|nr:LysE family translocator [Sulfurospirillum arcachonense]